MNFTLEEKIKLVSGKTAWRTNDLDGKLPSLLMSDGPHGLRIPNEEGTVIQNNNSRYATAFPTASAAACSWDTELIAEEAKAIAGEAKANKLGVVLGPGINIKRSPLCGRNFEYYSEDPFLAGSLATSFVNSMQSEGVGTSLKHYAVNSREAFRMTSNSQVDERALREIYTKAFEMTVKNAQPTTIMASYNRVNGVYGCKNKHLLTELLRDEWGFEGLVVSDWGACTNLAEAVNAGMDLEMPGNKGLHFAELRYAMSKGELTEATLTQAANRVARLAIEQSKKQVDTKADYDYSNSVALKMATESAVLLENDGLLPIKPGKKVIVIGDLAKNIRFQGGGSSHINTKPLVNAVDALTSYGLDVDYRQGYDARILISRPDLEEKALDDISEDDIVLFFGGLTDRIEGEGYDRSDLEIPRNQLRLLSLLLKKTENVAFIAFGGAPMNLKFRHKMRAILLMHLGGQAVCEAAAKLITGEATPCGKLAETYPLKLSDTPCHKYFGRYNLDIQYRESIFVGYRYYNTYQRRVMYPFGYGLSYTHFKYSGLKCKRSFSGGSMDIEVTVKNIGDMPGREIVELYVSNPKCRYLRAARELRGFAKTKTLAPGESQTLTITIDNSAFSLFDIDSNTFIMPSGNYRIEIGASLEDIRLSRQIAVQGVEYNPDKRAELSEYFLQTKSSFTISKEQFAKLYGRPFSALNCVKKGDFTRENSIGQLAKESALGKAIKGVATLGIRGMYLGKPKDDPEVKMLLSGALEGTIDSASCQSSGILPMSLAEAVVDAANEGSVKAIKKLVTKKLKRKK